MPKSTHRTLTLEEAEEKMKNAKAIQDRWLMKVFLFYCLYLGTFLFFHYQESTGTGSNSTKKGKEVKEKSWKEKILAGESLQERFSSFVLTWN